MTSSHSNATSGRETLHIRPETALHQLQGICTAHKKAKSRPAELARAAAAICPRTKCEKLVVMPQLGHGTPKKVRNVHGGRPSC